MRIDTVYFDMDGVLVDFVGGCEKLFGKKHDGDFHFYSSWGITQDEFWETICNCENFWADLEPYDWMDEILDLPSLDVEVKIASHPCRDPDCWGQKARWVDEHFGRAWEMLHLCGDKSRLADEHSLLIDDNQTIIDKWRAAGGHAILFPQPWNFNAPCAKHRVAYVTEALKEIGARA